MKIVPHVKFFVPNGSRLLSELAHRKTNGYTTQPTHGNIPLKTRYANSWAVTFLPYSRRAQLQRAHTLRKQTTDLRVTLIKKTFPL